MTLRISALIFIGYFLCLMAVFCGMGDWMNVGGCLVCGVCYVLSFYTTYLDHTRESAWISQILMIVWILSLIHIFLEKEKRPMKVEVQLRTIAMDFWASLEHKLRYKKNIPESEAEYLAKELVECASISASPVSYTHLHSRDRNRGYSYHGCRWYI